MSYLDQPYPNNFQELCAAMPLFYLDVKEMRAILRAQGHALDGVCDGMERLVDVDFVLTADEAVIGMWERALEITYKSRLTLEQRKRVVISYIIGLGHIGEREIRGIIGQYTPDHVDFDFLRGTISILVEGKIFDEENLVEALLRRIPAHLRLEMSIHTRRTYRFDVPIGRGGAVMTCSRYGPASQTRRAAWGLDISYGGAIGSGYSCPPAGSRRSHALPISVSRGGFLPSEVTGAVPDTLRTVVDGQDGARGAYTRVRIKPRRIDREEGST